jgi:hypothetical protein
LRRTSAAGALGAIAAGSTGAISPGSAGNSDLATGSDLPRSPVVPSAGAWEDRVLDGPASGEKGSTGVLQEFGTRNVLQATVVSGVSPTSDVSEVADSPEPSLRNPENRDFPEYATLISGGRVPLGGRLGGSLSSRLHTWFRV